MRPLLRHGKEAVKKRPWVRRVARVGIAALIGATAVAVGFVAQLATDSVVIGNSTELSLTGATKGTFIVSSRQRALEGGPLRGLFPGGSEKLVLKVTNPNSFRIVVRSITVDAEDAGDDCVASNLITRDYVGPPVGVPKNGIRRVSVEISMRRNSSDGCQGATFPLVFGGTATKQ